MIHLISLHGAMLGGQKIKITEIDAVNGQKTDQHTLPDGDISSTEDILFEGDTAAPILAWTDKAFKAIKVNLLGTKTTTTLSVEKKGEELQRIKILAPRGINALAHFLVEFTSAENHWAEVYHIDLAKSAITKAYDLPKLAGKGAFAASVSDANVYFTRIADGALTVTSSTSHGIIERFMLQQIVPTVFGNPEPVFAVAEVMPKPGGSGAAVRAAALLSSGDWALLLNGQLAWSRPEALTLAESVVFAEPAHGEGLARELAIEEDASMPTAYMHRLVRHIEELKHFPTWLQRQPAKIFNSISGNSIGQKAEKFGFNKLVIAATSNGRLIGVDAGNGGHVAWSHPLPDYKAYGTWEVPTLHASAPGIVRVKTANGHWVYGMDGQLLRKGTEPTSKAALACDIKYNMVDGQLQGFAGNNTAPHWTFKTQPGERILSVLSRPAEDPVAQIGIVLGDRRVLYKYLNPNLALVISAYDAADTISATVLDAVSGNILHEAKHTGVDTSRPVVAALSENWLVYHYTLKAGPTARSRGYILVTSHLMESASPNDRGPLGAAANYSSLSPLAADAAKPYVLSQSYQILEEISSFTVTQTKQGITTRMLMAVLPESNSIVGIPTHILDPRRTVGRDPTSQEQMEGLTRYMPVLELNPQWFLNHQREVIGVKKIVTSPAVLESTSLVFAFGVDVFGTRVTPSMSFDILGKEFNKLQMLGTVAALFVGVVFVAPLVSSLQAHIEILRVLLTLMNRSSKNRLTCVGRYRSDIPIENVTLRFLTVLALLKLTQILTQSKPKKRFNVSPKDTFVLTGSNPH